MTLLTHAISDEGDRVGLRLERTRCARTLHLTMVTGRGGDNHSSTSIVSRTAAAAAAPSTCCSMLCECCATHMAKATLMSHHES
jgi:hypothetical protein